MSEPVKRYTCLGAQFCSGGAGYGLIEILWRGYTHISMLIAGGICFCFIIKLAKSDNCLFIKSLIGGIFITAVEFAAGCVVNIWLNLAVWDYSEEVCQFMGQICARYALLWILLCAITIPLCGMFIELNSRAEVKGRFSALAGKLALYKPRHLSRNIPRQRFD